MGALFLLVYSFPAWWLLTLGEPRDRDRGDRGGIGFGVNVMLGPQCAMLPEMFGNRHRYLGVAMARELRGARRWTRRRARAPTSSP
jgi:MHS family metabolite:H+ symporter-like MFS transporter